jgi:hypothetical protein
MNSIPPLADADSDFNARVIEVLAAVAILVLLMALALRDDRPDLDKARVAEGFSLARSFQIDAELFYAQHGAWSINALDEPAGNEVETMQLENGVITLHYRPTHGRTAADASSLRPTVETDAKFPATVFWSCGYAIPQAGFTVHGASRTTRSSAYLSALCR